MLDVLYQEAKEGGIVDVKTICEKLPILPTKNSQYTHNLITGVLSHLQDDKDAEYVRYEKAGRITEKGRLVIEN